MRLEVDNRSLPDDALLITCSSHEERCLGLFRNAPKFKPKSALVFHYDDDNPWRETNHLLLLSELRTRQTAVVEMQFNEERAVSSFRLNAIALKNLLKTESHCPLILDMSVFTKRHLLMTLRWIDDQGLWDKLIITYSEPSDYNVSQYIHLSFGLSSVRPVPGFPSTPDISRPLHLIMFLGYEGDRAFATYEYLQPIETTLIIASQAYHSAWEGRTQEYNKDLISIVGESNIDFMSAIDPDEVLTRLTKLLGRYSQRAETARVICPLGTKPQTLGIYSYVRNLADPPSIIYASPLRHNHGFFSNGIGRTWRLK